MENGEPRGQVREFSDQDLRDDLQAGLKPAEIAKKRGVSRQAVYKRIKSLELSTTAAVVAPQESQRFVSSTINAMDELTRCLHRVNRLQDACDEWLRDAHDPRKYDVGPRSEEVEVTYLKEIGEDGKRIRVKAQLQALLDEVGCVGEIQRSEFKHADPRKLILDTAAECRQIVHEAADLARMLAEAKRMEEFRQIVVAAIAAASPEVAHEVIQALRSSLVVHAAFRGPETVPGA